MVISRGLRLLACASLLSGCASPGGEVSAKEPGEHVGTVGGGTSQFRQFEELIAKLQSDAIETRESARRELKALCDKHAKEWKPWLEQAANRESMPAEVRIALNEVVRSMPILALKLSNSKKHAVGDRLAIEVSVVNVGEEKQTVVRVLDGSDAWNRYPRLTIEITGPDGKPLELSPPARLCPDLWAIRLTDIADLEPGQALRVLDTSDGNSRTLGELPITWDFALKAPGNYRVQVRLDYGAGTLDEWNGEKERPRLTPELRERLKLVPKVEIAGEIDVTVFDP